MIESSVGVFFNLLRKLKIPVKRVIVVVFALVRRVVLTNLGPCLINATPVVRLKMFA